MAFTVTYNGNGSDGGSVPVDPKSYSAGDTVNVLPAGSMTKTGAVFAYWNTQPNGSGTFHGWPQDTSFSMPAANVVLYAQWFVTTGLTKDGATTRYRFFYDSTLQGSGLEPGRTNALIQKAEADYAIMANWFKGVTSTGPSPRPVYVTRLTGGANNTGDIRLKPNSNNPDELRSYLVSEITESFMQGQGKGWGFLPGPGATNENSCGEGLSLFLTQQFELSQGIAGPYTAFTANGWLNSSLSASDPNSTRTVTNPDGSVTDFGSRSDYVNSTLPYPGNGPGTGCSILFIYYLFHQLSFTIEEIIAAAPGFTNGNLNATAPLRGVYRNLTGDGGDPFPFFKLLLDEAFPPNLTASIPGANPDDPWPRYHLRFWGGKNTWGRDEVGDLLAHQGGVYPNAFSLVVEGTNRRGLGSSLPPEVSVAFPGVTAGLSKGGIGYETDSTATPQRIRFSYDVVFGVTALAAFPAAGQKAADVEASVTVLGRNRSARSVFFFVAGANPYYTNVAPAPVSGLAYTPWLSNDLRVFTATPEMSNPPVPGGPLFGDMNTESAYKYIQDLIAHFNATYGDPNGIDPFNPDSNVLPGQDYAFALDTSVAPWVEASGNGYGNLNFAIARVRLKGTQGPSGAAANVKVFFRVWATQTADTDWQPGYTYLSATPGGSPAWPLAPADNHTIPFFATGNAPSLGSPNDPEYGPNGVNNRTITIQQRDGQWAYFGCFLNFYDLGFTVNGQPVSHWLVGTHHCLVAEIAYSGTPITNALGVVMSPENSDKLAQRNLQVTFSDNPGPLETHRVPQTFDTRPSAPPADASGLLSQPDELMIDWGNTPPGSTASIYWPQVAAAEVLALEKSFHPTQRLAALDAHTVRCTTVRGVAYVPIPFGTGGSFAGLFTVDLPPGVAAGQEFNITVRRVSTRQVSVSKPLPPPVIKIEVPPGGGVAPSPAAAPAARTDDGPIVERYVVGSFMVNIPVSTSAVILPIEENILAIFKARLAAMNPSNRWYPVLQRYIGLVSARIDRLGGNASAVPASFDGMPRPSRGGEPCGREAEWVGKVCGLIFDHFGDLEGFVLETETSEHRFASREREARVLVERAWRERLLIAVEAGAEQPHRIRRIIILKPPEPFCG